MSDQTSTPRTNAVIESPYNYPAETEKNAVVILCRQLERELAAVTAERDALRKALQRIADCDWVVTLPDRMDGVRAIAKAAIDAAKEGEAEVV